MKTTTQSLKLTEARGLKPCRPGKPLVVVGHVLNYTTRQKSEFVNLTQLVEERIGESGIRDGMALVQSLHSTAAVFVNEWQDALLDDFRALLEQAVCADAPWRHNDPRYSDCERGNAASHLRALLLGTSAVLAVRGGRLVRGDWQSIILAELDGPRTRSVSLQVFGA
jgi:secondary thiamine-phosphate synthase enzyme